jgi:hypothetical protein
MQKKMEGASLQVMFMPRMTTSTVDATFMLNKMGYVRARNSGSTSKSQSEMQPRTVYEVHISNSEGKERVVVVDQNDVSNCGESASTLPAATPLAD